MTSLTEILVHFFVAGSIFYFLFGRKRKNYPPGPFPYPILGNLLEIRQGFHQYFWKQSKRYGPISSAKLGLKRVIVLHDIKLIKEAFNEHVFTGRSPSPISDFLAGANDGKLGVLQAHGQTWVEQRRFALRTLRDFGFGRKGMESLILDEVQELMNWIGKQNGKPIDLHRRISLAVVNALWLILTGVRYEHDDEKLVKIFEDLELAANAILNGQGKARLVAFFPEVAKLIPNMSGWNYLKGLAKVREDLFDSIILEHRQTRNEDHARDYIDVYLREVEKTESPTSSFHCSTAYKSLQSVMSDLFLAGSDTTTTTLRWAILYLIHNPLVLRKLQAEIDNLVGNSRLPNLKDRIRMPYTEAFIMEVLRYSSILPLGVAHATLEDVQFHGYDIPKGTVVLSNIYAVHFDPKLWGDPQVFRPERFLNNDGLTVQKNDFLIPFSTGKRFCLGFNLASDQLFLFITCLVQRFDISSEPGKNRPTLEPNLGQITLAPKPYSVVMKERC